MVCACVGLIAMKEYLYHLYTPETLCLQTDLTCPTVARTWPHLKK